MLFEVGLQDCLVQITNNPLSQSSYQLSVVILPHLSTHQPNWLHLPEAVPVASVRFPSFLPLLYLVKLYCADGFQPGTQYGGALSFQVQVPVSSGVYGISTSLDIRCILK